MSGKEDADLAAIIRRLSTPLEPEPTGVDPRLPKLKGIRAVVFDVYGTLLISGSGDISLTSGVSKGDAAAAAFSASFPRPPAQVDSGQFEGDQLVEQLRTAIVDAHAASDVDFPEVEIRKLWRSIFNQFPAELLFANTDRFAVHYECRVNPIWPMPGLIETLASIRGADLAMGIVSNAQFFTPIAFEALVDQDVAALGFDERLCVWSYEHLQAKPGRFLYDKAVERLAERGIAPDEVLYVGNDMLNDVMPAAAVGFRTALFAGDARSLRLREGDPRVAGVAPDAVITELRQLLTVLPLAGA